MPTIKDVAALSGVSVSTVSIILNGQANHRRISAETQAKVAKAIETLNYRPNVSAKKLRSNNKEYNIGVYWAADFRTNFLARLISGMQSQVLQYKYPVNIVICPYKNDYLYMEKGLQNESSFHAAIIANTSPVDMKFLEKHVPRIPIVLYNRYSEHYNTVTIDNFDAGRKAALQFISNGLTDIGLVLHRKPYLAMHLRTQGFIETCRQNGIVIPKQNIITTENLTDESALFDGVLAAEKFLKMPHRPRAIYCDSDSLAQGMLHVLNKNQIKIPDDVAIIAIGLGSPDVNKYSNPPLTVVEIPIEKIAAECIKSIINIMEQKVEMPYHVCYDTELIIRESCK